MKPIFYHKRAKAKGKKRGDPRTQVLWVRGWSSEDADCERMDHVVNITSGSHPLPLSDSVSALCQELNLVFTRYYNGEIGFKRGK